MSDAAAPAPRPTGFWTVLWLLLVAARTRARGRQRRQRELLGSRGKRAGDPLGGLALFGVLCLALVVNVWAALLIRQAVRAGQRLEGQPAGKLVVHRWFKRQVDEFLATTASPAGPAGALTAKPLVLAPTGKGAATSHPLRLGSGDPPTVSELSPGSTWTPPGLVPEPSYWTEASQLAREYGESAGELEAQLRDAVRRHGSADLVTGAEAPAGLDALAGSHSLAALLGSLVLLWWTLMLVFQGEGLELDLQRRRHPLWEWLFSHPVRPGAVFAAEILAPMAANPIYWGAPLFVGVAYGLVYGGGLGLLAAPLLGIPLTVALAALGKALEIGVVIRSSLRSRGALLGLMSWAGYAALVPLLFGAPSAAHFLPAAARLLQPLCVLPWPWLGWFLGRRPDGVFSFLCGWLVVWSAAAAILALAVGFCVWATRRGLSGSWAEAPTSRGTARSKRITLAREPLYRKEFLWFIRDRSAVVQIVLIPATVGAVQLFSLQGLLRHAGSSWSAWSGSAILFGTYFLWVLGPRALASEGSALWLALTWPRGLESLLKAKARLWAMVSTAAVALVLVGAVYRFPAEAWKVALVGVGWLVFARSMAEKTVTLITVTSSSGEPEPVPRGRRWAASLGLLTFALGVLTQQWTLAVTGVVYSSLTAAAMWESFRARLPFLYDPWSERLPPAPTLLHAMVAVSLLAEGSAVLSALFLAFAGREHLAAARNAAYGLSAVLVSVGTWQFLRGRGVQLAAVWCWPRANGTRMRETKSGWRDGDGRRRGIGLWWALFGGVAGGLLLGFFARGYVAALLHFPALAEPILQARRQMAEVPGLQAAYALCAVAFAPWAEEYLFRGLLFRALDREWGGWRALLGSAAFFAVYHPPLAWLPVGLLGVAAALLFKGSGRLAPAVALHLAYNAVVTIG